MSDVDKKITEVTDNRGNGDKPSGVVCDYSKIGRGWSKRITRLQADVSKANVVVIAKQNDDATDAQRFEFMKERAIAAETVADADEETDVLLTKVIVSVSRQWLLEDAPKDLDWSDPDSIEWVREDRYGELIKEVMMQRNDLRDQKKK